MRVLGIDIGGSDSLLVVLDGTAKEFKAQPLSPSRLRLPAAGPEVDQLIALKKQMHEVLKSNGVESVAVIKAGHGTSPMRAKVECVIQIASSEVSVPCTLVAAQTVTAAEKRRVNAVAGPHLDQTLRAIKPGYLRRAAYCAWSVLNVPK
jgi:hypothetical protein